MIKVCHVEQIQIKKQRVVTYLKVASKLVLEEARN
jgi:hypothetical protein